MCCLSKPPAPGNKKQDIFIHVTFYKVGSSPVQLPTQSKTHLTCCKVAHQCLQSLTGISCLLPAPAPTATGPLNSPSRATASQSSGGCDQEPSPWARAAAVKLTMSGCSSAENNHLQSRYCDLPIHLSHPSRQTWIQYFQTNVTGNPFNRKVDAKYMPRIAKVHLPLTWKLPHCKMNRNQMLVEKLHCVSKFFHLDVGKHCDLEIRPPRISKAGLTERPHSPCLRSRSYAQNVNTEQQKQQA